MKPGTVQRQAWMKKGFRVSTIDGDGVITDVEYTEKGNVQFVYRFAIRLDGHTYSGHFLPNQVEELKMEGVGA